MSFDKIKVLMLCWEFPPWLTGGLGPACYGLAKALAPFTELTVVVPKSDPRFKMKQVTIIGLNQFDFDETTGELVLPESSGLLDSEVRLDYEGEVEGTELKALFADADSYGPDVMKKVQAYSAVVKLFDEIFDFTVIHAHDWLTFPAAKALKEKTGAPLLVHIHSLETDRSGPEARNETYDIELAAMTVADRVLPVSSFTRSAILQHYGIDAEKIRPVYNAIESEAVFRVKRDDQEKRVLFLGRITRQKGPKFLLETMIKLSAVMPDVKFFIAGTGDQESQLKEGVKNAGLEDRAVFTGYVQRDEVLKLLASCDAYFMPSVSEPFGLSALEAAQFHLPCVLSKQSGVSEVLHNVLKADCWDTDKLANYLYAVLTYDGLRKTMIRLTANDVKNIHWDNAAREVLKSYKHVLAAESAGPEEKSKEL
jgi:hypothetical protein